MSSRPDDSFERRFALEQAVKFVARRHGGSVSNTDAEARFTIDTANTFLKFLKGER